ncbi:beta-ketoacyl-[acyl-carrier-protein] synthase family protein [Candidatus Margulisiibacteriota bacterium]
MKRRVVITGIGVIAPNGLTKESFWETIIEGKSDMAHTKRFNTEHFNSKLAAEVKNFDPTKYIDKKTARRLDLATQFAVAASYDAIKDARLDLEKEDKERIGIYDGTSLGGAAWALNQHAKLLQGNKKINGLVPVYGFPGASSGQIALEHGLKGNSFTVSAGCASTNIAVILASKSIAADENDLLIVGGTEAPLHPLIFGAWSSLKAMSMNNSTPNRACKPFDKNRDGFVIGEGSAFFILEEYNRAKNRKANIYAEIIGDGTTCDAYHMSAPENSGEQIARAIDLALKKAKIDPTAVDYINAHGTGTILNDKTETMAIKKSFNKHAYNTLISSTKPVTGHLLGAAGAVELAVCALALKHGIVPPTANYEEPDPECDLFYVPNKKIEKNINTTLTCSYGFGGKNACILLRKSS